MGLSFHDFFGRQERLFREAAWDFNYTVPADKEQQLYDFYMLNFLDMLDLAPHRHEERAFSELDVDKFQWILLGVKEKLYPYLAANIRKSLFFAICCEMRHALDYCNFQDILSQLLDGKPPNLTSRNLVRRSENRHPKVEPYDDSVGGPATLSVHSSSYNEQKQGYTFQIHGYGSIDMSFQTVFDIARDDSTYNAMRTVESMLFPREPKPAEPEPEPPKPAAKEEPEDPGNKSYKWSDWLKKMKQTGNLPHEQTVYEAKKTKSDDSDEDDELTGIRSKLGDGGDAVEFEVYGVVGKKTFKSYKIPLKSVMSLAKLGKEQGDEAILSWLQEQFGVEKRHLSAVANEVMQYYRGVQHFATPNGAKFLVAKGQAGWEMRSLPQGVIDAVVAAMEEYDSPKAKAVLSKAGVPEDEASDLSQYIEGNFWNPEHKRVCASLVSFIKSQATSHGDLSEVISQDVPDAAWRTRDLPHGSEQLAEIWSRFKQEMGSMPAHVKNRSARYDKRFGVDPASSTYKQSYKAALAACNDRRKLFARLAEYVFEYGHWPSSFGGYAWWRIARGYQRVADASKPWEELQKRGDPVTYFMGNKDKLYKPTIGNAGVIPHLANASMGQQYVGMSGDMEYKAARASALQSMHDAIDHCYDLVHNTGPAFNKVASWHKNSSDSWLRAALDEKAAEDIRSPFDLYHKVSPDMQKLCAEITHRFFGDDLESFQRRLAKKGKSMKSGGYNEPGNKSYIEPLRQMRRKHYAMITTRFMDSKQPTTTEPDWQSVDTMRITIPKAAWPWVNSMPRDEDFHWDLTMEDMPEFLKKSGADFTLATNRDDTAARIHAKFPELKDYVCASLSRYLEEKAAKKLKRVERLLNTAAAAALKKQKTVTPANKPKPSKPASAAQPAATPPAPSPQETGGMLKSSSNYWLETENGKNDIGLGGAKRISTYYFENGHYSDPIYQSFCRAFMHYGASPADTLKFLQTYLEPNSSAGQQVKDFQINLVEFNNLVNEKVMTRLGSTPNLSKVEALLAGKTSQPEKMKAIKAVEGSNPCSNIFAMRLLTTYYALTLSLQSQEQGDEIKHTEQNGYCTFYVPGSLSPISFKSGKCAEFNIVTPRVQKYAYMAKNGAAGTAAGELRSTVAYMSEEAADALVAYMGKSINLPAGFQPPADEYSQPQKPTPEQPQAASGSPQQANPDEFAGTNADGSVKHKYVNGGANVEFHLKNQYETKVVSISATEAGAMSKAVIGGNKMAIVKQLKSQYGIKLFSAQVLAEYIAEHISDTISHVDTGGFGNIIFHIHHHTDKTSSTLSKPKVKEIAQMVKTGEKIKAIKYLKETLSLGLGAAKALAEYIEKVFGPEVEANITGVIQGYKVTFTVGNDTVSMTKDEVANLPVGNVDPVNVKALDNLSTQKAQLVLQYIVKNWESVFKPWVDGGAQNQGITHSLDGHSVTFKTPQGQVSIDGSSLADIWNADDPPSGAYAEIKKHSGTKLDDANVKDLWEYIKSKWSTVFKPWLGSTHTKSQPKVSHSVENGYVKFTVHTQTGGAKKVFYLDKDQVKKLHSVKNDVQYLAGLASIPEEDAVDVIQYVAKKWDGEFKSLVGAGDDPGSGAPEYYKAQVGGSEREGKTSPKDMDKDIVNEIQMSIHSAYSAEGGSYSIPAKYNGSTDQFVYLKVKWDLLKEIYDTESTLFADYARLQKEGDITGQDGGSDKLNDLTAYGTHMHIIVRWNKIKETMAQFAKQKTSTKTGAKKPGVKPPPAVVPDPKFPKVEHPETGIVVQRPVKMGALWIFVPSKYFMKQSGTAWQRAMISNKSIEFVRQKVANNKENEALNWLKSCMPNLTEAGYIAMSNCLNAKKPTDPTKYLVDF